MNVVVIIDCFELFIERSSNLNTWSSYKHHNIAKVLLGITLQYNLFQNVGEAV